MKLKLHIGLVAFLFLFLGALQAQEIRQATLSNIQGEVLVRQGTGDWKPATDGMKLSIQDEVKTAQGSTAQVVLDNGEVTIKERSLFKIDAMDVDPQSGDKTTYLDLALGRIMVHAQKLEGNSKFEVRTPTSTTGVRGTMFEVSAE